MISFLICRFIPVLWSHLVPYTQSCTPSTFQYSSEISACFQLHFSGNQILKLKASKLNCMYNFHVLLHPSGMTAISTYFLTKELWNRGAGLFAACFIAIGKTVSTNLPAIASVLPGIIVFLFFSSRLYQSFCGWKLRQ